MMEDDGFVGASRNAVSMMQIEQRAIASGR
jgi:hypothetical protein